ncbi:uncharacterized protein MONOS_12311 [Monocercomonoides exilis]|uniref:uncharacterized protein n=1 Tax=Monocercomonoides exilis TaxID=2049356 RepID=UPI00355964F0|nr:hypothetical protein MONOS_12311 [Monocercomonoides exilis]|eukprot:MONOS_12311.1-p1 / transcript=MONOS_12311.1 / gene=MONOS_12311 / organism=Monocercomonoides_exilis_PA203 / gene_product=unspecified product / transcript_product=unspecified product / location=Mono_scaffold00674:18939-19334(-) / protein_length=112 / sequence_SO=supercontig / SO=protein_coding / is_pseudo=false
MEDVEFFQMLEEASKVNKLVKSVIASAERTIADGREEIRAQKELSQQFKPFLGEGAQRKLPSTTKHEQITSASQRAKETASSDEKKRHQKQKLEESILSDASSSEDALPSR